MHSVGWFAFQHVTTTESMYNSRVRGSHPLNTSRKEPTGVGRHRGAARPRLPHGWGPRGEIPARRHPCDFRKSRTVQIKASYRSDG